MDLTGWLDYFTTGLATQMDEVKERGTKVIKIDLLVREHNLNERQAKALGFVLEKGKLQLKDYEQLATGVDRRTLQRDLKALLQKNIFEESGVGPTDPNRAYVLREGGNKL